MIAALVSQVRGLAVFDDGGSLGVLLEEHGEPKRLPEPALTRLLRGAGDVEALNVGDLGELRDALAERRIREEALHAALLLISGESSMELRRVAALTWARLTSTQVRPIVNGAVPDLGDLGFEAREPSALAWWGKPLSATECWVEGVLMALPAPPTADFSGTLMLLSERSRAVIRRVQARQPRIRAVHAAFLGACRKLGVQSMAPLRSRAVREGWFRALVLDEQPVPAKTDHAARFLAAWVELAESAD